jgi:CBS domain-containing protein
MVEDKYLIGPDSSIEDALKKIDLNLRRGLVVVEDGKAIGSITDGDIRKAVLAHRLLITPVRDIMNPNFSRFMADNIPDEKTRIRVFTHRGIFLIPVVDYDMNLVDIIVRSA